MAARRFARSRVLLLVAAAIAIIAAGSAARAEPNAIRDTEIENDIRTLATPVWRAAGLDPNDVAVYMIQDSQLNSFVAGGQAIFINTGLILRAETPNQLIGVIAHETGHIVGGHVLSAKEAMHNASIESIIAMVAAAAASYAGRSSAPLLGAQAVGERAFLQFSIGQEATADHAAMNFLDRACQSARGLLKFFEILQQEEMLSGESQAQDPWLRTHPLTAQRIDYVRDHVQRARCSNVTDSPASIELLRRIKVKLRAFLDPPSSTLAAFPESDHSVLARYARAIAYYRVPNLDKALPTIDGLIRDFPSDPYYRELKGQMLFENGHTRDAIRPYEEAVRLAASAPLLRISLAQVYIESGDAALNRRAIAYLNDASREEGRDSQVWHFLAVAYGRDNQLGMAALSLAEQALADGKKKDAIQQSIRAKQLLARNTAAFGRAENINHEADLLDN
ncbi:MAG TPA: M48 family metalloprotease [Stellaceae bacterium]|jgi:predicted Zn-dependent protease|nr:M48 family metalloprotease [Stellaceae bacterium]